MHSTVPVGCGAQLHECVAEQAAEENNLGGRGLGLWLWEVGLPAQCFQFAGELMNMFAGC